MTRNDMPCGDNGSVTLSIILPSLNVFKYIRECIESVISQTLRDIEIICVDAGSDDGTLDVIREFARIDRRIKLIVSDRKSYGLQVNLGIDASRGKYVAIVETDDVVPPEMFEVLISKAEQANADFVKADFYRFTSKPDGTKRLVLNRLSRDKRYYNRVLCPASEPGVFKLIMNTWSGVYRKSFLSLNGIRHHESPGASFQDNGFWFQTFMYAKRALFVDMPFYMNRRDREESSVYSDSKVWAMRDEYDYIRKLIDENNKKNFVALCNYFRFCGYYYNTLWRIRAEFRPQFLAHFSEEFRRLLADCGIDRSLFGSKEWQDLLSIMFTSDAVDLADQSMIRERIASNICDSNTSEVPVSIIVPAYNVEAYVGECMDSLLGQTFRQIEIVCVDDGSTDGTLAILERYAKIDDRVRVFHQENMGPSKARNLGLTLARGRYVFFVDADDGLRQDAVEVVMAKAEHEDSDIVVFGFDERHYHAEGEVPGWLENKNSNHDASYAVFTPDVLFKEPAGMPMVWRNCYRRALIEEHGVRFVDELRMGEDTVFQLELFPFAKNIVFMKDRLYYYRCSHQGSLMDAIGRDLIKKTHDHVVIVQEALRKLIFNGKISIMRPQFVTWAVNFIFGEYFTIDSSLACQVAGEVEHTVRLLTGGDVGRWLGPVNRKRLCKVHEDASRIKSGIVEIEHSEALHESCQDPIVSVVVPVHNAITTIRQCIDSLLTQPIDGIEVICVDDASTDGTAAVLADIARRDKRLRIISYREQKWAGQARKDGVLESRGKYILFCDADDVYDPGSIALLCDEMSRRPVDILHYGTTVVNCGASRADEEWLNAHLAPFLGNLKGEEVFSGCFRHELYSAALWNKMFSAELCKKAFLEVEDGAFPRGQDLYAYAVLSYHAKDYRGVANLRAYRYNLGLGKDGRREITRDEFLSFCSFSKVILALERFLRGHDAFERHQITWRAIRSRMIGDVVNKWLNKLPDGDKGFGLDAMLEVFPKAEICQSVARRYWGRSGDLARILDGSNLRSVGCRNIKTVGMYYHRLVNGGVERVMQLLSRLYVSMGYEVVIITDIQDDGDLWPLPEGVRRVMIPNAGIANPGAYYLRSSAIIQACREERIDICLYHAWNTALLMYDMLCYKSAGVPVIVHTHNVFTLRLRDLDPYFAEMPSVYSVADGVVTLSDADRDFWHNFNPNTFLVFNPMSLDISKDCQGSRGHQTVLWVARLSCEKHPEEAIKIFRLVHERKPDVSFRMLGRAESETYESRLRKLASENHLDDVLEFCGFDSDTRPYYREASVFLSTSEYEGFSLTFYEAKAMSLPIVTYELPWLTTLRPATGCQSVAFGDAAAAADKICELLDDEEVWKLHSEQALADALRASQYDYARAWTEIFESVKEARSVDSDGPAGVMWQTMMSHYALAVARGRIRASAGANAAAVAGTAVKARDIRSSDAKTSAGKGAVNSAGAKSRASGAKEAEQVSMSARERENLIREIKALSSSESYRVGLVVTWPFRLAKKLIVNSMRRKA